MTPDLNGTQSKGAPIPSRVGFTLRSQILRLAPGLALSAAIAALAIMASGSLFAGAVSPLFIAMGLGIIYRNLAGTPSAIVPGLKFGLRRILRAGVMLLGLQLTISQIMEVQLTGVAIIAVTLVATFLFTVWMGRTLGVERKLTELIAAGTSICGASAIIVTNTVTRVSDEDVTYAVACVTIFGSISMFVYPLLPGLPSATSLRHVGRSLHPRGCAISRGGLSGRRGGRPHGNRSETEPGDNVGARGRGAQRLGRSTEPERGGRYGIGSHAPALFRSRL